MKHLLSHADARVDNNLGLRTIPSVIQQTDIGIDEFGRRRPERGTLAYRVWTSEVPKMRVSIENLSAAGCHPTHLSEDAVRPATRELVSEVE